MSENMFEKFNGMFDLDGLKKDISEAATSSGDFVEVPKGDYEVKVVKIELGETGEKSKNPGMPMAKVWFEVVAGDYKGQKIFMNQMLTSAFGFHKMNEFLDSLESGVPVLFENFTQYDALFKEIFREIDGKGEYALHYAENNKGYSTYTITERFA
jgi:hypothetical protein